MKNSDRPIYPQLQVASGDYIKTQEDFKGLTKREYFAGLAMQGVLSHNHPQNPTPNQAEEIVKYAIGLADALLEVLSKP